MQKICVFAVKNRGLLIMPLPVGFIMAKAFLGQKGVTDNKMEGDKKTPIGTYNLGIVFGTHDEEYVKKVNKILIEKNKYIKIKENHYWVCDSNSKFYNNLVETNEKLDSKKAEHLIDYKKEYEFAIEIKYNDEKKPGKGSAIFLHCKDKKYTSGCIAISKRKMLKLLKKIQENAIISIYKL